MRPAAGAFTTPEPMPATQPSQGVPQRVPQAVPSASDPAAFLEQLKGLGLLDPVPQNVPLNVPRPAQPMERPSLGQAGGLTMPGPLQSEMPPRPTKKGSFEPGKPGQARSGMTAHQMMRNPDVIRTLAEKIGEWEQANPNRVLMGSHIQQMLPEVSAAQARTIKRMLEKARLAQVTPTGVDGHLRQGAAKALKDGY